MLTIGTEGRAEMDYEESSSGTGRVAEISEIPERATDEHIEVRCTAKD
jgi:hypothetical protein